MAQSEKQAAIAKPNQAVEVINNRRVSYGADKIFPSRWSPRAMSGEDVPDKMLMRLFEAARWAPSSYNSQPWRFVYAKKGTAYWDRFFGLLAEGNKAWAKNASALVILVSKTTFDYNGQFSRTHMFDTGAAWENLALQGSMSGLAVHGMSGFDYDRARELLSLPKEYEVAMMFAIGMPGDKDELPEGLRKIEFPNERKALSEIAFEGSLKFPDKKDLVALT